jgi:hypothetical protein
MEMLAGIQAKRGLTSIVVTRENEIATAPAEHIRFRDGQIERERIARLRPSSTLLAPASLFAIPTANLDLKAFSSEQLIRFQDGSCIYFF